MSKISIKVPSARQLCGRCRTAVMRHVEAHEEEGTRQLFHLRCWRAERKERKKQLRAVRREIETDLLAVLEPVKPAEEAIMDLQLVRGFVDRGIAAQRAVDEILATPRRSKARVWEEPPSEPRRPQPPPERRQKPPEPPAEPPAALASPVGRIVRKDEPWSPTRRRKGIRKLLGDWILSHPPGEWFSIAQGADWLAAQGITTSLGTVQATLGTLFTRLGPRLLRFREGNLRAYSLVPDVGTQEGWGRASHALDVMHRDQEALEAHGENGHKPHGERDLKYPEAARAIDRAMNDLSALIGELIAETRKELRKELGL